MGAPPSSNNSTNTEPKVTARSSNARYGGCFDLCISLGVPEQTDEKRVHVDFDVQLAQEWSVKLSEQAGELLRTNGGSLRHCHCAHADLTTCSLIDLQTSSREWIK